MLAAAAAPAAAVVSTTTSSGGPYACNGVITTFPVAFPFQDQAHLEVVRSTGAATATLALGADYTVTGAGGASGTVTLTAGWRCANGSTLTILRVVPLTQPTPFSTQGPFSPKAHERAFDRVVMSLQQLDRDRAELAAKEAADISALAAINVAGTADASILAPLPGGGATTRRTLAERFAESANVKDFGAVGDGLADDAPAILAAQVAVGRSGTVVLPPGTYRLGSTLPVDGSPQIVGAGRGKTILRYAGGSVAVQVNSGAGITTHGWRLADLTIDGASSGATGLRLGQLSVSPLSAGGRIERVDVTGFTSAAIDLVASQITQFVDVHAQDNSGDALVVEGAASPNGNANTLTTFQHSRFLRSKRGAYVKQFDTFLFDGCEFEDNSEEGLLIERPNDANMVTRLLHVRDSYFEDNNGGGARTPSYAQAKFTTLGSSSLSNVKVSGTRFQGGGGSNRAISVGKGTFQLDDNEVAGGPASGWFYAENTSVAYVHGRSRYAPATEWTLDGGSAAVLAWESVQNGLWSFWNNVSGTLTQTMSAAAGVLTATLPTNYEAIDVTGTTLIASTGKASVRVSASGATNLYGLDASNGVHPIGSVVTLTFADANSRVWASRSGDTLRYFHLRDLNDTTQHWDPGAGDSLTVVKLPDHSWQEIGRSYAAGPRTLYGTTPPAVGTYTQGDYMRNTASTVGQPKGWYCTVGGSPGTWVSEGNL